MNTTRHRSLAGLVLAMLALMIVPPSLQAAPPTGAVWVKYQDLPRRVRETVDRERGRHDVKQVLEYRWSDRLVYRVVIDERGSDKMLLLSDSGRILRESDVPDLPVGHGSFEKWVKYEDLPRDVRRTLDRERGNHEVRVIQFVRRDNREFYRCIIDQRGDDLAVRIGPSGKILSMEEVDDWAVGRESARWDYNRERAIRFDDVPREVRRTIDRERDGRPVKQVVYVDRNSHRFYRAVIDDRRGDRIIRVAEDGYLFEEREVPDVAVGPGGWDKNRWGHEQPMRYNDLPWEIRTTLDRERRGRDVKEIIYVRRYNSTFYRCIIDTRGEDTAVRISDEGTVLSREQVGDTAYGRDEAEHFGAREEWVKYATLPPAAQRTLDRYRRDRDVLKIIRVELRGSVYFRCIVDTKPWPSTVNIGEDGRMLSQ